jgi:hypothetical protein
MWREQDIVLCIIAIWLRQLLVALSWNALSLQGYARVIADRSSIGGSRWIGQHTGFCRA